MSRRSRLDKLVSDAMLILTSIGIPLEGLTGRRKVKMAKAFLSVAGMKPGMAWTEARSDNRLRSRDVIRWMNEHLGESISSGSYDDIRRKDLISVVEAEYVLNSAKKEGAATMTAHGPTRLVPPRQRCFIPMTHPLGLNNWRDSLLAGNN